MTQKVFHLERDHIFSARMYPITLNVNKSVKVKSPRTTSYLFLPGHKMQRINWMETHSWTSLKFFRSVISRNLVWILKFTVNNAHSYLKGDSLQPSKSLPVANFLGEIKNNLLNIYFVFRDSKFLYFSVWDFTISSPTPWLHITPWCTLSPQCTMQNDHHPITPWLCLPWFQAQFHHWLLYPFVYPR